MNPYADNEPVIRSVTDLFGNYHLLPSKRRETERGMLLEYFAKKLSVNIGFVAYKLTGIPTEDLYVLKSKADKYELEGKGPWAKCFHGALKVPKE